MADKPDRPRQTRSERKRADILLAAVAEFQDRGFQGTSMDRIARRAKVSKPTIYHHFASKQALFDTITEQWAQAHQAVTIPYDPDTPLDIQLTALGQAVVEFVTDEDFLKAARATLGEYFRSPELARVAFARFAQDEDGVTAWIRAATADDRLAVSDPVIAGTQFKALLKAFVFWPQMIADAPVPAARETTAIISTAVEMFLGYYGRDA